jgi:hypothetical protein
MKEFLLVAPRFPKEHHSFCFDKSYFRLKEKFKQKNELERQVE